MVALACASVPLTAWSQALQIIDASGDGASSVLDAASRLGVDSGGSVFVSGILSDNAFRITPGGSIIEVIDASGDGAGSTLDHPN